MYKQCKLPNGNIANCIIRTSDGAIIPFDEANVDYQQYLKWIAEGNVAQPAENN